MLGCHCVSLTSACSCSQWDIKGCLRALLNLDLHLQEQIKEKPLPEVALLSCSSLGSDFGGHLNLMMTYNTLFSKQKFRSVLVLKSRMRRRVASLFQCQKPNPTARFQKPDTGSPMHPCRRSKLPSCQFCNVMTISNHQHFVAYLN